MRPNSSPILIAILALFLLGSCHSVPKHSRFIPKDALAVIGLNTGNISKEVAWSKITGSKILDELQQSADDPQAKTALKDIEHMGIDWMSTVYLYTKSDTRFSGTMRATAIAPLKNAGDWEVWVKKVFPEATIRPVGKRKEALLDKQVYAAWDDDVLMVMNTVVNKQQRNVHIGADSSWGGVPQDYTVTDEVTDEAATAAEVESSFKLADDASITTNKRFNALMKEAHDISFFINYDGMMNTTAGMLSNAAAVAMGNTLWKESAMTGGIDFQKGQIAGTFRYYSSDSMQGVAKELGKVNVDNDMLSRIPAQNLNMAAAYHLSMPAVQMMLDKMGYTGMANAQLAQVGLTIEDILSSLSGDIGFAMNNYSVSMQTGGTDSISQSLGMATYPVTRSDMDYVLALKINNRPTFDKIMTLALSTGALQPTAPNTYLTTLGMLGQATIVVGDKYVALSGKPANAQQFIGTAGTIPGPVKAEIAGHPVGLYADIQSFLTQAKGVMGNSPSDSTALSEAQHLLRDVYMHGGEYNKDANEYSFALRLVNKGENSLLQILQTIQHMAAAEKSQRAGRTKQVAVQ